MKEIICNFILKTGVMLKERDVVKQNEENEENEENENEFEISLC